LICIGLWRQKIFTLYNSIIVDFTKKLLRWNKLSNTRLMPWKGEKDPYKIWLSEIILQQTRVEQGWAYYEKFINVFPTIHQLAKAPEKKIFKLWEGLGYYSRCRNLIQTAKKIVKDYNGKFPSSYDEIRKLKGIGPYTAAAISSFAFNLPYAVVDGNVERVLARYFGVITPVDTSAGKNFYTLLASALLNKNQPGIYNQAMMDFGAVICKPQNPLCTMCIQSKDCMAYNKGWISLLPVKAKTIVKKNRWFYYFIIETNDGRVYLKKRIEEDIWKNLYEFVLWETGKLIPQQQIPVSDFVVEFFKKQKFTITGISKIYKQHLTHQTIHGQFIYVLLQKPIPALKDYTLVKKSNLREYPFPKLIAAHLQNPVQQLF
jgi:A/G-specific adenine glycosylase